MLSLTPHGSRVNPGGDVPKRQPALHDLVLCVHAPTVIIGDRAGQLGGAGGTGVLHGDTRVLSKAELTLAGSDLEPMLAVADGASRVRFVLLARGLGDPTPDPTVRVERRRHAEADGVSEDVVIVSTATVPVRTSVRLRVAADLAPMVAVKSGEDGDPMTFTLVENGLRWGDGVRVVTLTGAGASVDPAGELGGAAGLPPGGRAVLRWRLRVIDRTALFTAPSTPVEWSRPVVTADDPRLAALVDQSLDDLAALRLSSAGDTFLAAGAPWFLTLFGRDSLWAARMLLPLGTELAASTLRVLAARQGKIVDDERAEAPGKILHEVRRAESVQPITGDRKSVV